MMRKTIIAIFIFLFISILLYPELIGNIIIEGNKKVSRDTIMFYMRSKVNSIYSKNILKQDFQSLWKTGFFENISIISDDRDGKKIVTIKVKENLLITSISYNTGKKIKQGDINDKLQENNIVLMPYSYFNPAKTKKIEKLIKELLLDKGFNDGKVNITTEKDKENIKLAINVIEGSKTKIGEVVFKGLNPKLISPSFLRRGMKNNKTHSLFSTVGGKDIYNEDKINEDLEQIKLRLRQKGYLEAKLGKPSFSFIYKTTIWGKIQKMLRVTIPVELGPQYRLGDVSIEGNKIIKSQYLRQLITLKKGKIYNAKKRNDLIEKIQKIYGSLGYFYCQIAPVENLDPVKKITDLTIKIVENDVVYLGKLEFAGNTFTKDHVIRREWFLREGRRLNINALEDSIRRMKQLGLVTIDKMPEIKPDPENPQMINIKAEVREINRQMINFNVGYSGYDGWFIALGYSTQNFLGLGETFALNFQSGTRAKNYRFAFTEPYLFNLSASLGIDLFKTSLRYPSLYTREGEGFNISTAARFWKFWGISLVYSFENVEVSDVNENLSWSNPYSYYYYAEGKRTISSISPTIYYRTVDSPIFPSSGVKYLFNYRYSGGFFGGDIDLHKFKFEFVKFFPLPKRHVFGMHAVVQYMKSFGENPIPFYEKFFLGGERQIRGFDIYRIGPRDENGYTVGGDKSFYMNFEYSIPMNQQMSFVFFYDVGNAYDTGKPMNFKDVYSSMGLEFKLFIPMLNVPFRLIFAYNPRTLNENDPHFAFRFGVGPSFY